eukprot:9524919-Lingulodinium_polyedra.AAC.1
MFAILIVGARPGSTAPVLPLSPNHGKPEVCRFGAMDRSQKEAFGPLPEIMETGAKRRRDAKGSSRTWEYVEGYCHVQRVEVGR